MIKLTPEKKRSFLTMMRPANMVTASMNVLAGGMVSYFTTQSYYGLADTLVVAFEVIVLACVSALLYGAGCIQNDYVDYEIDLRERPERPLPLNQVTLEEAFYAYVGCMGVAVLLAFIVSFWAGLFVLIIIGSTCAYNLFLKNDPLFGPLTMGACRAFNTGLGMSLAASFSVLFLLFPLCMWLYTACISICAKDEVEEQASEDPVQLSLMGDAFNAFLLLVIGSIYAESFLFTLFLAAFAGVVGHAKWNAIKENDPLNRQRAVKTAVLGMLGLDAVFVAIGGTVVHALIPIAAVPIVIQLGKRFAVT